MSGAKIQRRSGSPAERVGRALSVIIGALLGVLFAADVNAADVPIDYGFLRDAESVRHVVIIVNKSRTIQVPKSFAKVVVGNADIADVLPTMNRALYIQGKKVGTTNISIFDEAGALMGVLDLEVSPDTGFLQQRIQASTGNRDITVSSSGGQVVLTGIAMDTVSADRALSVAKAIVGEANVVNAMQVAPSQQVLLEVRFLEVARTAGRQLGINWFGAGPAGVRGFNSGLPGGPISPVVPPNVAPSSDGSFEGPYRPLGVPIFRTTGTLGAIAGQPSLPFATFLANVLNSGNGSLDVLVTALEQKGLVRRLAEPNLIALSGDAARFLAGGEFPVPVASSAGQGLPFITIQWKKFGVQLGFVPTVLARGVINLRVEPSVSELDFSNAVSISGTTVPTIITRDARTTVELRDGQSYAIAGLLQTRNRRDVSQIPWIGSVPVLGALFRSPSYLQEETDLVVIITPRLVAPAAPGQKLASPLESRLPSNDVDFFLNGQPEVRKRYHDFVTTGGDLKGPYGHLIVPELGGVGIVAGRNDVVLQASK